jgi:hypothetical protein
MKIRRFMGRGREGDMVKDEIPVPPLLYTFDEGYHMRMWIPVEITADVFRARPMRMANVHGDGRICWGLGNLTSHDFRSQVYAYWGSNFNDDLTPYGEVADMQAFQQTEEYSRTIHPLMVERARVASNKALRITRDTRDLITNAVLSMTVKLRRSKEQAEEAMERNYVRDERTRAMYGSIQYEIERADAMGNTERADWLRERLRVRRELHPAAYSIFIRYDNQVTAIRNTVRALYNEVDMYAQQWSLIRGRFNRVVADNEDARRAREQTRDWIKNQGARNIRENTRELIDNYGADEDALRLFVARVLKLRVANNDMTAQSQIADQAFRDWQRKQVKAERERWWKQAGWSKFGEISDIKRYIMGTRFTYESEGFDAVIVVDWNELLVDPNREADRALFALYTHMREPDQFAVRVHIPAWRNPNDPNMLLTVFNGFPLTMALDNSGQSGHLKGYSEDRARIDTLASEVFG